MMLLKKDYTGSVCCAIEPVYNCTSKVFLLPAGNGTLAGEGLQRRCFYEWIAQQAQIFRQ